MSRRRLQRLAIAFVAMCSLLWAQLALAAHACPMGAMGPAPATMHHCEGMAAASPTALCHQHCAGAAQSPDTLDMPAPVLPALLQVLELPALPESGLLSAGSPAAAPELQPPPDPVFLATRRLRV
jgi:hypothetical protein